jgi:hypothetical protein
MWHCRLSILIVVFELVSGHVGLAAETQRIGLPAGYYEIPARGKLRIDGYCMDQNVLAPSVGVSVSPIGDDEGRSVSPEGASPVSLSKAVAEKMLEFKTQERSLNEYLEQTEHSADNMSVPSGTVFFKWKFDPPGADSDTGRLRAKFGNLPLTEAMQEIRRTRIEAGADPKSATNMISLSKQVDQPFQAFQINNDVQIPAPVLFVEKDQLVPPQIRLGATVTNLTDAPLLLELRTPLIVSTNKKRGVENIDPAMIKTAKEYVEREKTQQRVWEANETLAAAKSRDYHQYLTRFAQMPYYRGHIVKGLVHDKDETLVYVNTGETLEVRRVKDDAQEVVLSGPDAENAFEKLPNHSRASRTSPPKHSQGQRLPLPR